MFQVESRRRAEMKKADDTLKQFLKASLFRMFIRFIWYGALIILAFFI